MANQVSNQVVVLEGEVMKNLPNTLFEVKVKDSEVVILCYLSGKMRKHYIKLVPGDKVEVELTPYDLTKGRISFRLKD